MTDKFSKLVLLGYMASGKTTLGEHLAEALNWSFIDLDQYISQRENKSIPEIFELKGEDFFRDKEKFYLDEILHNPQQTVISLGGGTPTLEGVMEMINADSVSVYLNTGVEQLVKRLQPKKTERPMLSQIPDDVLFTYIETHLSQRMAYYQMADITVTTDEKSEKEIVVEILNLYRRFLFENEK